MYEYSLRHFSDPNIPTIPGLSLFPGSVIHSHLYREPEAYKRQRVLIIGSAQSGRDISLDLSSHASQVYLSNRGNPFLTALPSNVEELPGITEVKDDGSVLFNDDKERTVDSIILATGYVYSFPFLDEDAGVKVIDGVRVAPLYKHTFNPIHPSMALVGLNFGFNPFPVFHYQAHWILSVWYGSKTLPDKESMIQDDEDCYQKRLLQGLPHRKAGHFLGPAQWELLDLLAHLGGSEPQPPVVKMLYDEVFKHRTENLMEYKSMNYAIVSRDRWEAIDR